MEDNPSKEVDELLKWASSLGISDSPFSQSLDHSSSCLGRSLAISHFPGHGGRGLCAIRDLAKGEVILRVPRPALLTREVLTKDRITSLAVNAHPSLSPTQIFTVCLLHEMGKGNCSTWYYYLMCLPKQYDLLAGFHEFERRAFQVDDAVWTAEKAVSSALLEWREARLLMRELGLKPRLLTFRAWIWALGTISSRTLHVPWDTAGCLCPVGDLFNYTIPIMEQDSIDNLESRDASLLDNLSNGNTADSLVDYQLTDGGFNEDIDAYCFYARKNYRKGEQVLLCYGTHTNLELLQHYGFLLRDNPNDKLFIPLEPEIYSSISYPTESLHVHQDGTPSFALLSALRSWAAPQDGRRSIQRHVFSGSMVSADNEKLVANFLLNKCKLILAALPTGIEEDESLLSAIERIQLPLVDHADPDGLEMVLASLRGHVSPFLDPMNVMPGGGGSTAVELFLRKKKRVLDRWKLAVHWRLMFKRTLVDCITYCTESIHSFH